jgi:hypothetical protein
MIFVNGIQRSGTNFVKKLYPGSIDYIKPYYKHDPKMEGIDPECDKVLCVVKNPYTWVESICFRNEVDIVKWFPSYILRDAEDYLGPFNINLPRLLTVYKCFYTSWLNYEKTKLVRYEDVLVKNRNVSDVPMSDNWDPVKIRSYLKYEAPLLPDKAKSVITKNLGQEFFDRIGYPTK